MRTVIKVAAGVLLAAGVLIGASVGLLGLGLNGAQKTSDRNGITRAQFDQIHTGMSEAEVKAVIGNVPEASTTSYSATAADVKIGERCLHYNEIGRLISIYQLCFDEGGRGLVSKTSLDSGGISSSTEAPSAVTSPEEPPTAAPSSPDTSSAGFDVVDSFTTPSGRSSCQLLQATDGTNAVQCGRSAGTVAYRLATSGEASRVPWTPPADDVPAAAYDQTLYMRGGTPKLDGSPTDLRCVVHEDTGVECVNSDGHGFRVSVQAQKSF